MIARALRLRRPFEFERVRRQGRSWATPLVVMAVLPNDLGQNRYGFAVGRRVGKAAARNRVKRWMREATRRLHPCLQQGYDIVFIARGTMADPGVTYHQVYDAIAVLTERAKLRQHREDCSQASPDTRGTPP
ncbi:MAG: ribonuclease P protein component [Sphaerobacter sp.]|nr:ribonuclease P protein component [Sphaerobacter sp.]